MIPSPTKTILVPSSVTRVRTCATMARRLHAPLGVDERSSYDSYLTVSVGNTGNHRNRICGEDGRDGRLRILEHRVDGGDECRAVVTDSDRDVIRPYVIDDTAAR